MHVYLELACVFPLEIIVPYFVFAGKCFIVGIMNPERRGSTSILECIQLPRINPHEPVALWSCAAFCPSISATLQLGLPYPCVSVGLQVHKPVNELYSPICLVLSSVADIIWEITLCNKKFRADAVWAGNHMNDSRYSICRVCIPVQFGAKNLYKWTCSDFVFFRKGSCGTAGMVTMLRSGLR